MKDVVRNALREAEKDGRNGCARADLERINAIVEALRGNGGKAKAIFASASQNFWREYDLPPQLPKTQVILNQRFHLKPLAALLRESRKTLIVLADRTKARVFKLSDDEITELQDSSTSHAPRQERWFAGYDAAMPNAVYRMRPPALQSHCRLCEGTLRARRLRPLLIGCHDEQWPEIEPICIPASRS